MHVPFAPALLAVAVAAGSVTGSLAEATGGSRIPAGGEFMSSYTPSAAWTDPVTGADARRVEAPRAAAVSRTRRGPRRR